MVYIPIEQIHNASYYFLFRQTLISSADTQVYTYNAITIVDTSAIVIISPITKVEHRTILTLDILLISAIFEDSVRLLTRS